MKASDLFVACLAEEGVARIFGVPGEENLDLIESLRGSSIELVVTRHEQHAAFMAAAWGRLTGRAGVCLSTLGPGATNLITGVAHAQLGGMPLVAITGQKPLRDNRQGNFQLLDVVGVMSPITKWSRTVADAGSIPRFVRHAFKVAEDERPGATHLELPEDVAAQTVDGAPQRRVTLRRPIPDAEALRRAAEHVRAARRPLLLVSSGANRKRIGAELRAFVEATGIHAVSTQTGKGVLPEDHPQSLFGLGIHSKDYVHAAMEAADLVITLGYDIVEYPPAVWNDGDKTVLHVDFRMAEPDVHYGPDFELVGDVAAALSGLREALDGWRTDDALFPRLRAAIHEKLHLDPCPECFPPGPRQVVRAVREVLDPEDVVSLDNGIYKIWFARMYPTLADNTLLLDNALATMGAGLATAMSARLWSTDEGLPRRVLAVCGDGGFLMNEQDLETAVRLGLDLVVLILRDDAYGFIRWKQTHEGFPDHGMTFGNPDFPALARAYGAEGQSVTADDPLADVLQRAFTRGGVVLVDCPVDYADNVLLSTDLIDEVRPLVDDGAAP